MDAVLTTINGTGLMAMVAVLPVNFLFLFFLPRV